MTTIRFTGMRTGKTEMMIPGHGLVRVGDVLEVPEARAASWTTLHPTSEPGVFTADFTESIEDPTDEPREEAQTDVDATAVDIDDAEKAADPAVTKRSRRHAGSEGDTL